MWFKVDDSFFMNPKTAMLSDSATALWLRAGSWSAQQLTGGFIPARMLPLFRGSEESADELCDAGLWERDIDRHGYIFHDWSDYQPDAEQVEALREKRAEAGRRGAKRRWERAVDGKNGKTYGKCHGKPMANAWQTDGKSMANLCPVPVPVPGKKEEENKFSSSKEKTDLDAFQTSRELANANSEIIKAYPELDLPDSWNAFTAHHHGETRTVTDWTRQWKGWCERRAKMGGIPPSKPHVHSWQCSHVLAALHRTLETAQPDQQACQLADQLNKEES